jgi:cyclic-di-GMP-binding protein
MPSFDIVSKIDSHEINNAIDQANREVTTRFDFKGTNAKFELVEEKVTLIAPSDFQLKQMSDILQNKMAKRGVDARSLDYQNPEVSLHEAKQVANIRQGISSEMAKKIVKLIKDKKLKVQPSIQGDQVRVAGKKRDDLQTVIAMLEEEKLDLPLQFENFRD